MALGIKPKASKRARTRRPRSRRSSNRIKQQGMPTKAKSSSKSYRHNIPEPTNPKPRQDPATPATNQAPMRSCGVDTHSTNDATPTKLNNSATYADATYAWSHSGQKTCSSNSIQESSTMVRSRKNVKAEHTKPVSTSYMFIPTGAPCAKSSFHLTKVVHWCLPCKRSPTMAHRWRRKHFC